jgi:hypothetical protein
MRACFERAGVPTEGSGADINGVQLPAFKVGRGQTASSVLIFKSAAGARKDFYSVLAPGAASMVAGRIEVLVAGGSTVPVATVERCVYGANSRPLLSPGVPGQPVPTPADAHLSATVRQKVQSLKVFRRGQNAQDVAGSRGAYFGVVPALTRLAGTLPDHTHIYFAVYTGLGPRGYGSSIMLVWKPLDSELEGLLGDGYGLSELPSSTAGAPGSEQVGPRLAIWEALLPNDVARVRWTWPRTSRRPGLARTIRTPDNLAVVITSSAYSELPRSVAYSATGKILATS